MAVPNIFGTATAAIPLSQLDTNFATAITLGNTAVYLGNTTTSLGNVTLTNVTISSGNVTVTSPAIFPAGTAALPAITTTGDTNTGIFFPAADTIAFSEGGVEAARFDASGNFGLGVTPSAWATGSNAYKALQIGAGSSLAGWASDAGTELSANAFWNSGWKYIATAAAARYQITSTAEHRWLTAPSGTAGNAITFTQAMTLDASGNLGLGATSITPRDSGARTLELYGTSSGRAAIKFTNSTSGTGATDGMFLGYDDQLNFTLNNNEAGYISFATSNTERARIDSSGNLLVGTTGQPISGVNSRFIVSYAIADYAIGIYQTNASPYGQIIKYSATPNNTGNEFLVCSDGTANRITLRSNGGIANYSANDVNLSDRREKTNFAPAKSYLDVICAIPVQTFNYIDQNMEDDGGLTLGVVAQDVQAVAPELVMESNWAGKDEEPKMRLSIYQTDLQYALMKCIQEQQALITQLTARITALEGA